MQVEGGTFNMQHTTAYHAPPHFASPPAPQPDDQPTAAEVEAEVRNVVDGLNLAKKWPTQKRVDHELRQRAFRDHTIGEPLGKACIAALDEFVARGIVRRSEP